MLSQLRIQDIAIITECDIEFEEGLNVITGETGAGKSIIINALTLLFGKPASEDLIAHHATQGLVEGIFKLDKVPKELEEFADEDNTIIVTRLIRKNKTSIARLNNQTVPIKTLKRCIEPLVNISSQHEQLHLKDPQLQRQLVDSYCNTTFEKLLPNYQKDYKHYQQTLQQINDLNTLTNQDPQQIEFLRFQIKDIAEHDFKENEDETLKAQRQSQKNAQKIQQTFNTLSSHISSSQTQLEQALKATQKTDQFTQEIQDKLTPLSVKCQDILSKLQDIDFETSKLLQEYQHQTQNTSEIESRLDTIFTYKTKYQTQTINTLLELLDSLKQKLSQIESAQTQLHTLQKEADNQKEALLETAKKLYQHRNKTAQDLSKTLSKKLHDLNMPDAKLELNVSLTPDVLTSDGADAIQTQISTNPGEPLKPLEKVASGGELSRLTLAIKSTLKDNQRIPVTIFDEIDTGIGGLTASIMGEYIYKLAKNNQVVCITHLPQIAKYADNHLKVEKKSTTNDTTTQIYPLEKQAIKKELERMVGGKEILSSLT